MGVSMVGSRTYCGVAIAFAITLSIDTAIAQGNSSLPPLPKTTPLPSPDPPPPLTPQQAASMEKFVKDEIREGREVSDRIQEEVNRTFGWTIGLLNTLITVLIAIPIVTGLAALYLRRSIIGQVVQEIQKELELVRAELRVQAARDLKEQLAVFKQELENAKLNFTNQLQTLSLTAQQEKDRIFQELAKITPSIIQEEFVAPEVQQRIKELTDQLDALKSQNGQLSLSASDYLKQGDALYIERRLKDAISSYEKALALDSTLVEAWIGKAKTLRRLKRYEEALAANEQVIQIQPDNAFGWHGKGVILEYLQKYDEAEIAHAQAIKLSPERSNFWRNRAFVLIKLGNYQEAWTCLNQALEIHPNSSTIHYVKAFYHAAQHQTELAFQSLSQAVQLNPTRSGFSEVVLAEPAFDTLRADDRVQHLICSQPVP